MPAGLPQPAQPGLFPCRSPARIPADGTEGHRALGDTQVGLARWGREGAQLGWDPHVLQPSLRVTRRHSGVCPNPCFSVLFASDLCLSLLWTQHCTYLESLSVTCSHRDLLGPPLCLLGSLPQSAEGKHRFQEKQGHSLLEEEPTASSEPSLMLCGSHHWPLIRTHGASLKLQTPEPYP